MKILVFSDLHGNLNALNALIETRDFKTADKIIFLGDVVFGASRPNECIELINKLNIDCIVGNNDSYVFDHIPEVDECTFSKDKLQQLDWMNKTVTKENKDIMRTWPKSITLTLKNKTFYFTHYMWEYYNNDFNVIDTPDKPNFEIYKNIFSDVEADYYIFGHEHRHYYFTDDKKHYFCLDSLGMRNSSNYLIITDVYNSLKLIPKTVSFDLEEEITLMDKAGYPYNKLEWRI